MSLKHNKKRNSFVIYEQLISLTTRLAAGGNKQEASAVIDFIKEHFGPHTEIGKEYRLLESMLCKPFQVGRFDLNAAESIIDESLRQAETLSNAKLTQEKTKLIENINKRLTKDVHKIPLKDYKAAASAQILINERRSGKIETSPLERVKMRKVLIDKMRPNLQEDTGEKIDNITFAVLSQVLTQRYAKLMNEDQKEILSTWSTFLIDGDEKKATSHLNEKIDKLKISLSGHMSAKKHRKAEHEPLLKEAYSKLVDTQFELNEQAVYEVMRFFDLVEDLDNYDAQKEA